MTRHRNDLDDLGAEFLSLWSAETADDLHRVLAFHQPIRASADWFEPFQLLARHHEDEPDTSVTTAMLLVTDQRWRKGVDLLIRHITESDMIDSTDLDMLAEVFIAAGDHVYWQVPKSWFDGESVAIDIESGEVVTVETDDAPPEETVAARRVSPPLRRWAAARLIARDPSAWGELFTNARDRRGAEGAAIVQGLMDELDRLPGAAQDLIIDAAADWPQAGVRRRALERLAGTGNRQRAHDKAAQDPSARIRKWAPTLLVEPTTASSGEPEDSSRTAVGGATRPAPESLF